MYPEKDLLISNPILDPQNKEQYRQYLIDNNIPINSKLTQDYYGLKQNGIIMGTTEPDDVKENIKRSFNYDPDVPKTLPIFKTKISDKVNHGMKRLINHGFSKEQASGIMGNLQAESSLNTKAVGDKGTSFGIAQWHNERWNNLKRFAQSRKTTEDDFDTQIDFLLHELNTSEKPALNALLKTKTPEDAARVFAHKFERMAKYEDRRHKNARKFYDSHK